jgi:hypothetical protein
VGGVAKEAGNEALSSSLGAVSSIILVHGVENVIAFRAYTILATTKTAGKYSCPTFRRKISPPSSGSKDKLRELGFPHAF